MVTVCTAQAQPHVQAVREARRVIDDMAAAHCAGRTVTGLSVGMPAADLLCLPAYRIPDDVRTLATASGTLTTQVYRRDVVYVSGGKVVAIRSRP